MMVMPRLPSLFSLLTNSAVLVPAVTATVLPRKSSAVLMSVLVRVIHLNCGTKNVYENPTCACRLVILAVEPHSISTVPLATRGRRVADVTGLYLTLRFGMASFAFTASTTCLHSSIENPIGCNLSSRYDNGIELSRWPMVMVPVSFTFFSVPSRLCVLAGAHTPTAKPAVTMTPIAVFMTLLLYLWTRMPRDQCLTGFGPSPRRSPRRGVPRSCRCRRHR